MPAIDPVLLTGFREAVRAKIRRDLEQEEATARTLREQVLPGVRQAIASARASGLCTRVWLFGSFAWGRPSDRSDVDLLVEGCADPDRLGGLVALRCGRDVHVIEWEQAPESLRTRVLEQGTVL